MTRRSAAVLLVYVGALVALGRRFTVDFHDGIDAIDNALLFMRTGPAYAHFVAQRPPLGWLLLSPVLAAAWRLGGPLAALKACHAVMPLFAGAVVAGSWAL